MSTLQKEESKEKWFDFKVVKEQSDVIKVLNHYNLLKKLEQRTKEFVGWCPLGTKKHGKKDSFNFNIKKKTFKCFACKQHGSTLDFVSKYQQLHLREACETLVFINEYVPLPQSNSEEVPVPITELDSEASEQTIEESKLAEIEGNALRSPSADDPATIPMGIKMPVDKSDKYHYTLEEALLLVSTNKADASRFIVLDKAVLFKFMDEMDELLGKIK